MLSRSILHRCLGGLLGMVVWAGPVRGDPVDRASIAAAQLAEAPNYRWVASVEDESGGYDIFGATERGGYTLVQMPVPAELRDVQPSPVERRGKLTAVFAGNTRCVIETQDGWYTPKELRAPEPEPPTSRPIRPRTSEMEPPDLALSRERILPPSRGGSASILDAPSGRRGLPQTERVANVPRSYGDLQLGVSHPHEELAIIVSSHASMRPERGWIEGTLTELGAKLLLVRDGQKHVTAKEAGGSFRLWIAQDRIVKYEVELQGTLEALGAYGRKTFVVQQKVMTTLNDIGTTRVEVEPAAQRRLAR